MIDMDQVLNLNDWGDENETRENYIKDHMKSVGYQWLGSGRHRMTFLAPHKRFVLKFARNHSGLWVNCREADLWSTHLWRLGREGIQYAPCRLIRGCILMMRTVVDLHGDTIACAVGQKALHSLQHICIERHGEVNSDFVNFTVDSGQIGRLPNGKWVAYDYGSE